MRQVTQQQITPSQPIPSARVISVVPSAPRRTTRRAAREARGAAHRRCGTVVGSAASGATRSAGNHTDNHGVRDGMALIYLLLFASPQLLLYLYLRERFPVTARRVLSVVFVVFNIPWIIVGVRMFSGSLWGISRVPYIAPFIAWQLLGWIFCALVVVYLVGKGIWWVVRRASF